MLREITYCEAIKEAIDQEMDRDSRVFNYGIGVTDHKGVFGTTIDLHKKYGDHRCFDTPIAEESMMGFGLGAALGGLRPIFNHIRVDFLLLAMNQIYNMVSSYRYMSGGQFDVPLVVRAVIGRGWGQGSQHSKSLHSIFSHIPGLKVILPTTPYDAKGMLIAAIRDNNPVICIEHRWLYWQKGHVPLDPYTVEIGCPQIIREGRDVSLVCLSWMTAEASHAAKILSRYGIEAEIVDVRSLQPLDDSIIVESVKKTKRCVIADCDWINYGASAEIASRIYAKCYDKLECSIDRLGFAFTPCPTARHLENEFYAGAKEIVSSVATMFGKNIDCSNENFYTHTNIFKGPF